jgi:hypothetical protein
MGNHTEELRGEIYSIFNPEPVVGSEGLEYYETPPLDRLKVAYSLDCSYWRPFEYGSCSELMHRSEVDDAELGITVRSQQVPFELLMGTLRLLGDSIVEYHDEKDRKGPYRFYPAILMSAWASFEAFVRIYSEVFVKTALSLPAAVQSALLEKEEQLDKRGNVQIGRKPRSLLDRYWLLLKYAYGVEFDRGGRIWQMGEAALKKRNALVHYEIVDLPSVMATELWGHLEAILLLLIGPSTQVGRSVMPSQYELHGMLDSLHPLIEEFEECPRHKGWPMEITGVCFPCPFQGVDESKFPSMAIRNPRNQIGK